MRNFDSLQVTALVIQTIEVIFIAVYFGSYGVSDSMYVSDLLFSAVPYRVLMTIFVVMQAIFALLFVFRLYSCDIVLFSVAGVGLVATVVGWITLNTQYLADDGTTSDTHKYGTLVFMMGMGAYFACLVFSI